MTAPGDRLSAHDGYALLSGRLFKRGEPVGECRSRHVIGKAAEGRIAPAGVHRILLRVSAAAELLQPTIADAAPAQIACEQRTLELRIVPRFGNRADIDHLLDAVRTQKPNKVFEAPVGMTDREKRPGHADLATTLQQTLNSRRSTA